MDNLRKHYQNWTRVWAVTIVFLSSYTITFVAPHMSGSIGQLLAKYAASTGVLSAAFFAGELFIRKMSWKSVSVLHRIGYHGQDPINYEGWWHGETLYEVLEQASTDQSVTVPFRTTHEVRINQDCLAVKVENTAGTSFASWGSVTATIDQEGILRFLYVVNYTDPARFKPRLFGYEWLSPFLRSPRDTGRPVIIHGRFGHTVGEHKPTYSGSTLFIRRGYAGSLTPEDLPKSFQNGELAARLTAGELV
jgi:hypothetical protein